MRFFLLLTFSLFLSYPAFSQNPPQIERNGDKIAEITNLMGTIPNMKCAEPSLIKGTVTKKWFEKDDLTIAGFTLSDAKGNGKSINLNNEQVKLLGEYSVDVMSSLIKNGKRLQIWTYNCAQGDSEIVIYASRIKPL